MSNIEEPSQDIPSDLTVTNDILSTTNMNNTEEERMPNNEERPALSPKQVKKHNIRVKKRKHYDDQHAELITLLKRREEQRQKDIQNLTKFNSTIETFGGHIKIMPSGLPPSVMIKQNLKFSIF